MVKAKRKKIAPKSKQKKKFSKTSKISDFDRVLAGISYWSIAFVIPFALGHDKPFVFHHAKQGAVLFLIQLCLIVIAIFPILGWLVTGLGWMAIVVCSVIGIFHAIAGEKWEVPYFGKKLEELLQY